MKPLIRDAEPMQHRLIKFSGDDPQNPTSEEILALALRHVLSMVVDERGAALHGLELDDPSGHFKICCATKIEMANKVIRAAQEYVDQLPPADY